MKTALLAAAAALTVSSTAYAQNADPVTDNSVDITSDNSVDVNSDNNLADNSDRSINDSFDDNRDYVDSFDDNREYVDSFDNNSDNFQGGIVVSEAKVFGDNAIVAEATLSNVVTGVDVDFGDVEDSAKFDNRLANSDNSFRNYSGMNALNQNTGIGASQNASVTIAVSSESLDVN